MSVWGKIAGRYLLSGKSASVTGWISGISAAGMAIGTAALIVILSVFNGFEATIRKNLRDSSPDYLIRPVQGKAFDCDRDCFRELEDLEGVTEAYPVLEENVAVKYRDAFTIARVRGLEQAWQCSVSIDLANELQIRTAWLDRLEIYFPSRSAEFSLTRPEAALESLSLRPANVVSLDGKVVILPLESARQLLGYEKEVTAYELRCDASVVPSLKQIQSLVGEDFEVLDRVMQEPSLYKMMSYEKAAIFLILLFVVLIVAFNIYASLSMLIIEKKQDRETLRSLGAGPSMIKRIFRTEGWMITWAGAFAGMLAGVLIVLLQQHFGLVSMPGNSLVSAYPVQLKFSDVVLTLAGVGLIGALVTAIGIYNIDKYED